MATNGAYDVDKVRGDFPALSMEVYGKPLVYLDNAASAQKPRAVLDRAKERGQVRREVTATDVALIPIMVGAVVERSRGVAPEVWQRVLGLALDGLRPTGEPLPGRPLSRTQFDRVMSSPRRHA